MNILAMYVHEWTIDFVNKVVQNPKHITVITFSSKPDVYPSASQARGQAFVMQMRKF